VNGLQLKLGLLGKVIGFSMLAMQIGHMQSFDQSQAQEMLRDLTSGLGVALLTTMVGLVANILLGLQLTRLDRYADEFLAQAQSHAVGGAGRVRGQIGQRHGINRVGHGHHTRSVYRAHLLDDGKEVIHAF
jgi:hypothetical protein